MTPEAERYLAKARLTLEHARTMLTVNLAEDAGRAAYLAGYQAAEALVFERTGRVAKTHKGLHAEFARLTRTDPRIDVDLRRFLPQSYDLKAICDYEVGPDAVVPPELAEAAVDKAFLFVDRIASILAGP
ncbi:MAG: HEPN domain-containing protein [Acetobacteraceae bacterium]|nr:HEPN domain-containing protein [Acetobacteraceae bacterium]